MAVTAFLFPGQGSQAVGMASMLAENSRIAKDILSEIDDALDFKLSVLMAEGPAEELQLTQNAQPALFASSICTLRVLQEQTGKTTSNLCSYVAGHSLGEYSALCAAGSLGIAETARLLRLRAQLNKVGYLCLVEKSHGFTPPNSPRHLTDQVAAQNISRCFWLNSDILHHRNISILKVNIS